MMAVGQPRYGCSPALCPCGWVHSCANVDSSPLYRWWCGGIKWLQAVFSSIVPPEVLVACAICYFPKPNWVTNLNLLPSTVAKIHRRWVPSVFSPCRPSVSPFFPYNHYIFLLPPRSGSREASCGPVERCKLFRWIWGRVYPNRIRCVWSVLRTISEGQQTKHK